MLYLFLAIFFLTLGHFFKTVRWKHFVDIYEEPNEKNLFRSLSIGYMLNFIFPLYLGEVFRIIYSGKRMKNGVAFSFGTVLLDRCIDVIAIGLLFSLIIIIGINDIVILDSAIFYIEISLLLIFIFFLSYLLNRYVKILIKKLASIFEKKIEFRILKMFFSFITTFKDMIFNINKIKLFSLTFFMWGSYFVSYFFIARSLTMYGNEINFLDLLVLLFSKNNLFMSSLMAILNVASDDLIYISIYLISPLVILIICSNFIKNYQNKNRKRLELIPHLSIESKLDFLKSYFSGENREYINNYLKINREISVVKDCSANSNAKTILCLYNNELFYRKFAFNDECAKLKFQVNWLNKYKDILLLPDIKYVKSGDNYLYYDMPYRKNAINYFEYIQAHTIDDNWSILSNVLNDLRKKLYKNGKIVSSKSINNYLDLKYLNNLEIVKKELKKLGKYDYIYINNKKYRNINIIEKILTKEYLFEIFKNDYVSDIHGDLTIDNIVSLITKKNKKYYLIDPNVDKILSSVNLDYAKLMQSLHGDYEYLTGIKCMEVINNSIQYDFIKTNEYKELYNKYVSYLKDNFTEEVIKSIYFHEIIHWLRLLPYKLRKDHTQFILAYSRFIIITNDIIEMYGVDKCEK